MQTTGLGRLILTDNGCLRLGDSEGRGRYAPMLIWPPDYSLITEGNNVRIINENGQVAAEVGDYIQVGGGGLSSLQVDAIPESLRQKLPERCSPPYHLVGFEVEVVRE